MMMMMMMMMMTMTIMTMMMIDGGGGDLSDCALLVQVWYEDLKRFVKHDSNFICVTCNHTGDDSHQDSILL